MCRNLIPGLIQIHSTENQVFLEVELEHVQYMKGFCASWQYNQYINLYLWFI